MKTHALVSMGSALFVIVSDYMVQVYANLPGMNPTMIPAQIIVGIGFLGAGAIMLQGSKVTGLTTAGGLWVTAAIGMTAGFGLLSLSIIATILVLFIFIVLNIIEEPIRNLAGKDPYTEKKES